LIPNPAVSCGAGSSASARRAEALLTTETPHDLIENHKNDPRVREVAHGEVALEDVFIGLTGRDP
jgi:hypothetical protein